MRQTGNFPVLTALSVPYALLLQDDSLSHFNCLSLSLLLFLCLLLSFLATQRLISCSRLKGRSLTGEEWSRAEAVCEITWVGCLREREEGGGREGERVRRASAPAVCRYFYQHELERGGGREQGVRWEKYEGVSKKENEKIWEKFIRVGGVVGGAM